MKPATGRNERPRQRVQLTPERIRAFVCPSDKEQAFLWDTKAPRLAVRVTRSGARTFIFEKKLNRRTVRVSIGDAEVWPLRSIWKKEGGGRVEVQRGAREEANRLEAMVDQGTDPREEAEARRAADEARRAERLAAAEVGKYSLATLVEAYVAHLRKRGKVSAGAVENCVRNHVAHAHPEVAGKPAKEVTVRDISSLLRPLTEAGKGRTAGKLRAYLRAAFALAAGAEVNPSVPAAFLPFGVEANPVAPVPSLGEFNHALDRALSEPELREYYSSLDQTPDSAIRDALLLLLMLGGQRVTQLVRATVSDADVTAKTLRLLDPKGKRQQARVHLLPLPPAALDIVRRCVKRAGDQESPWLFSTRGNAPLRPETLTKATGEIAAALLAKPKAQRVVKEVFQLRDIRRTCETRMAALGISRDLRAQIQSHGLGGIQAKHYDRHDYLPEKRAVLDAWVAFLERAPTDNVRRLPVAKARSARR